MANILLIIPPFHYGDLSTAGPVHPSIGIAYIAAMLEKEGHSVKIIDMFAMKYGEQEIIHYVQNTEIAVVGITCVSATFGVANRILEKIKRVKPKIVTIMGGPHVTILPEHALQSRFIDYLVIGEGDYTIVELLDYITKKKGKLERIKGICFRGKKGIVKTERRPFITNLDELPFPAYHLLPLDKYKSYGVYDSGRRTVSMITSRGCPFRCIYCCSSKLFGGMWRPMSAEKTIEHIKRLYDEFGIRHIYFQDDELTVSHDRVMKICDWIINNKLNLTWECLTRVSHVNDELLKKMSQAGCKSILYGVEVGYEDGLKKIKKGITLEQARNAIKFTKKNGMLAKASFIIGFPWESKEEIKKTINFARSLNADYAFFSVLCPFPTTEVYEQIKREGLFIHGFGIEMYGAMPSADSLIRTKHLSSEELVQMMGYAYKRLYFRPGYLFKRLLALRHFSELKRSINAGLSLLRFSIKSIQKNERGTAKV